MSTQSRLFIADDNADEIALLKRGFADAGRAVEIISVQDGASALAQLMEPGASFDLVLLDYHLPKRTGGEVVQELIERDAFPRCPVVLLTSHLRPESTRAMKAAGVRAILDKPIELEGYTKLAVYLLRLIDQV